jgi:Lon protease-like protein
VPEPIELPMFPLGTVLFPGTAIPLHVFEPRYRALTAWCIEHDGRLGVVLIERGSEVGGGDVRFAFGTQARIVESVALPDGRWVLAILGERRIRVERWLDETPFPRALVTLLDDEPPVRSSVDARAGRDLIEGRLRRALALKAELGEWPADDVDLPMAEDPDLAVWQVGALGLLGPADAQRLLATDGLDARLAVLVSQQALEALL